MSSEQIVRQHCATLPPKELVSLPVEELVRLMDDRDDERRRADALREHLTRRHGCNRDCCGTAS